MVEITINRPTCNIRFAGNPMTVAAELAAAISGIYQGLNSQEPMDAELFKDCVRRFMRDDSPVWNDPPEMVIVNVPQHKKGGTPTDQS